METNPHIPDPSGLPGQDIGFVSYGGLGRYNLVAESTIGFVAWKLPDGAVLGSEAAQVSLAASECIRFWACADYEDIHADELFP